MAKQHPFLNPALKQTSASNTNFNLVPNTTNFNSVFDVKPLEQVEASIIENLLIEGSHPESHSESQVHSDINVLKSITAEIKAIGKQGVLLMGVRIAKARDILKSYHNGTFTKWLDSTFGSKKTGYNLLTYFDFYMALSAPDLKEKFKKLPQKVAYILASRRGEMQKKEEIVRGYDENKCMDLVSIIHEQLPIRDKDKRGHKDSSLTRIIKLKEELTILFQRKKQLSQEGKILLRDLREMIDSFLVTPASKNERSKN